MSGHLNKSPLFPRYMRLPLLLVIIFHFSSYLLTKIITDNIAAYDLSTELDSCIPFSPFFIFFYILAYAQWLFSYIYHFRQSKESCYQLATSDLLSKIICAVCFILIPTTITRPVITGNGFFESITGIIFSLDTPVNLFPSMHCLMSWLCFRSSGLINRPSFAYTAVQFILSILVFASTVLVKQHFFIDIIFGIIVAEICWSLTRHFSLWRIFLRKERSFSLSDEQIKVDE